MQPEFITCACGCGQTLPRFSKWGYARKYLNGHRARLQVSSRVWRVCPICGISFALKASDVAIGRTNFCSRACTYEGRKSSPPSERFWAKVNKNGPVQPHCPELGPCWEWTAHRDNNGYGIISSQGGAKLLLAHRVGYEIQCGSIPAGMDVLHRCDNPPCIRGEHLFRGTQADNNRDMFAKGRGAKGPTHHSKLRPETVRRGERATFAKLTEQQVREIRTRYAATRALTALAIEYGIAKRNILKVVNRQTWKHVI